MTACPRRITAGAGSSDRPIQLGKSPRTAEILRLPRDYVTNQRRRIVLRSRLWIIEAVGPGGVWERSDGRGVEEKVVGPFPYAVEDLAEKSGSEDRTVEEEEEEEVEEDEKRENKKNLDRTVKVVVAAAVTVVLGVANRVLYKLALVPLKHYPFFLAQLATFGYIPLLPLSLIIIINYCY
jgi:hypothetical protein